MKGVLGFLAGLGVAWAALAIWQHRAVPDIDPADVPDVVPTASLLPFGRPGYGDCVGFGNAGSTL